LQTQATEGFQIYGTRLLELETKVAQIQLIVQIYLRHLLSVDQQDLVHGGFLLLPLSVVLQTSDYLGYLQTLLYYPYYFLDFRTFCLWFFNTLFTHCPFETKRGSNFIFGPGCIFKTVKYFCPRMVKGGVC
jgi:hypothetical protein